ncbi:MAG: tetratricopeptide repeat protein [Acidiferrobacterales bacterium]
MDIQKECYRFHDNGQESASIADWADLMLSRRDRTGGTHGTDQSSDDSLVAKCVQSYRPPAETEHASTAAFQLGSNYLATNDPNEAFRWYLRAAVLGHAGAQYNLGLMCLKGEGVSKNAFAGINWIELAADNGDKAAQKLLQRVDQMLVAR